MQKKTPRSGVIKTINVFLPKYENKNFKSYEGNFFKNLFFEITDLDVSYLLKTFGTKKIIDF